MRDPAQIALAALLLGLVALAVPERLAPPPDKDVAACGGGYGPLSYLPPEPWNSRCPSESVKKLAAR